MAVVLTLEFLFWKSLNAFLFYILFPGIAAHLMITGGHGGSHTEETIAPLVEILINMAVYVIVVTIARKIWPGGVELQNNLEAKDLKREKLTK